MKIKYIIGDATDPQIEEGTIFIAHCCNNIGGWGAGFSGALSRRYGMPELIYRKFANEQPEKLKESLGEIQVIPVEKNAFVVNIIGQEGIRNSRRKDAPIRYDSLKEGLIKTNEIMNNSKKPSLHMPRIGANLAGGSWDIIEEIIEDNIIYPTYVYTLSNEIDLFPQKIEDYILS